MSYTNYDKKMKAKELFKDLKAPNSSYLVLRIDGRNFHKVTDVLRKPFDVDFNMYMEHVAEQLLKELQGKYAYIQSDEISILFSRDWDMFDRRIEKLVSVSASLAASNFTRWMSQLSPVAFDSRVVVLSTVEDVVDYFSWRQADCTRCCLNAYAYWTLRQKENLNATVATKKLLKSNASAKNELLFKHGINFNDIPSRYKRGVGLVWEKIEKEAFNPKENKKVKCWRRLIKRIDELPMKQEYRRYINNLCGESFVSEWIDFDMAAKTHFNYKRINADNEIAGIEE